MLSELQAVRGTPARWRFALGCARIALLPPPTAVGRNPLFGLLAATPPPLGLPLVYFATVILVHWRKPVHRFTLEQPERRDGRGEDPLGIDGWLSGGGSAAGKRGPAAARAPAMVARRGNGSVRWRPRVFLTGMHFLAGQDWGCYPKVARNHRRPSTVHTFGAWL